MKVCLVGSSGGSFKPPIYVLKPFWKDKGSFLGYDFD